MAKKEKLKKIPSDIVSYVQIEGEAIKNANDKHMIVSYAQGKLDIINWYIELLEVGSNKYIVPHTKEHLINLKQQLTNAYKRIMDAPILAVNRTIAGVVLKYPKGYEG